MKEKNDSIKGRDSSTITVGDVDTPPSVMHRTTRLKISKEIEDLSSTINQLDL